MQFGIIICFSNVFWAYKYSQFKENTVNKNKYINKLKALSILLLFTINSKCSHSFHYKTNDNLTVNTNSNTINFQWKPHFWFQPKYLPLQKDSRIQLSSSHIHQDPLIRKLQQVKQNVLKPSHWVTLGPGNSICSAVIAFNERLVSRGTTLLLVVVLSVMCVSSSAEITPVLKGNLFWLS